MKEFDPEELAKANGKAGNPIYVAFEGKVYDVSASERWKGGLHMGRHRAGSDFSTAITAAPHTPDVLARFPQVGVLKRHATPERTLPTGIAAALGHFPILRRHPHPMVVHFPIALTFASAVFTVLYLLTGVPSFETTSLHCLAGAILFTPVAMATGWFTWWLNYLARPMKAVTVKIWCSWVLLILQAVLFSWRIAASSLTNLSFEARLLYGGLVISLLPLVSIIGWYGATMTFPVGKE